MWASPGHEEITSSAILEKKPDLPFFASSATLSVITVITWFVSSLNTDSIETARKRLLK